LEQNANWSIHGLSDEGAQVVNSTECERTKKTYKNLYWRISKKCRENNNIGVFTDCETSVPTHT
jgi:hypothetical protein